MEKQNFDLQVFVDRLVSEKEEFTSLEPEVLEQVKADLLERVSERVNFAVISNLPEDKLPDFDKLTDSGTDEEIQKFCEENISNLSELVAGELVAFKNLYLS